MTGTKVSSSANIHTALRSTDPPILLVLGVLPWAETHPGCDAGG